MNDKIIQVMVYIESVDTKEYLKTLNAKLILE